MRERLRVLLPAAAVTVGVSAVLCAWPLFETFGTGREIKRPVQTLGALGGSTAMLVNPSRSLLLHTGRPPHVHLTTIENGMYLGWPLLIALVVATVFLFRHRGVLIAAGIVIVAAAFQIYGSHWHLGGVSVRSPLGLLQDGVALTRHILPGRFAIAMWLAIVWLFAVGLDEALTRTHGRRHTVAVVAAVACLIPLLPAPQDQVRAPDPIPKLFTTSLRDTIPVGATVMIAPMATVGYNAAQLWQIRSGMRFRQVGGYALHAFGPHGRPSYYPYPKTLRRLFMISYLSNRPYERPVSRAELATARRELKKTHASMFLVGPSPTGTARHLRLAKLLLRRPPDRTVGGVAIWDLPAS